MDLFTACNNMTTTENGAATFKSSCNNTLDLFAMGGALRSRTPEDIQEMVEKAYTENAEDALKVLCYLRDIRNGGQGEKRTWKIALRYLVNKHMVNVDAAIKACVELGSWNDVFDVFTLNEYGPIVKKQFTEDVNSGNPTLLEKWMPSIGGKDNTKAEKLAKYLGLTPKQYRKTLSAARAKLKIVEQKMCAKNWGDIQYEHVPSKAMLNYMNAFKRNDSDRFRAYMNDVTSGEKKVNTTTLVPYEVMRKVDNALGIGIDLWSNSSDIDADKVDEETRRNLNTMWDNLPSINYKQNSAIVVADTSGSMRGLPLLVATSLAIYFADRNTGVFANKFITFSDEPTFVDMSNCKDILEKYECMYKSDWGRSTDLQRVFEMILQTAVAHHLPQSEMPETIYIVSDMEFNIATYCYGKGNSVTNYQVIKDKYEDAGYKLPNIIFWNVDSRQNNCPVTQHDEHTALVSGCSPSIFNQVVSNNLNPINFMLEAINKDIFIKHATEMLKNIDVKKAAFTQKKKTPVRKSTRYKTPSGGVVKSYH